MNTRRFSKGLGGVGGEERRAVRRKEGLGEGGKVPQVEIKHANRRSVKIKSGTQWSETLRREGQRQGKGDEQKISYVARDFFYTIGGVVFFPFMTRRQIMNHFIKTIVQSRNCSEVVVTIIIHRKFVFFCFHPC